MYAWDKCSRIMEKPYGRRTDIEGVLYLLSESTSCDISPHGFHKDCFFWRIGSLNTYQPEFIALTSHDLHSGFNVCDRWIWMWIAISDFNVPMSSWTARRYPVMVAIIIENEPILNNLTFFSLQYDCTHRCSVFLLHMLVLVSSTTAHTKMLGFWIFVTSWLIRPSSTMNSRWYNRFLRLVFLGFAIDRSLSFCIFDICSLYSCSDLGCFFPFLYIYNFKRFVVAA